MKTPKEFFKYIITPFLVIDVFVLIVILYDPISFYIKHSYDIPNTERIKIILGAFPELIFPYFFCWSFAYLFLAFLYFKIRKETIYSLFAVFMVIAKFCIGFFLMALIQSSKT